MSLSNLLTRLLPECSVIMPSDRLDLLPGLLMAHHSSAFGPLASIILTGGFDIPASVSTLLAGVEVDLPIAFTEGDTFATASKLQRINGVSTSTPRKTDVARALFGAHVDEDKLLEAIDLPRSEIRTPTMFEHQLMQLARSNKKCIVLPEGSDDRVLTAAAIVLQRQVADIVILGEPAVVSRRATELGLNLRDARVVNPHDPDMLDRFAIEYAKLRAHKGITVEQARKQFADPSYVGTMMVHLGMADGMVSGAMNTTANTIRPSLEFIKTKPGVGVVSGSFLMAMSNRVVVYADCAVNPDPTPEQLADIAIYSAETARAFDIEPRVAMLSYSTGTSGSGADVDKVRDELLDRYGNPPEPVASLLLVARFRARCRQAGVSEITMAGRNVRFAQVVLPDSRKARLNRLYPKSIVKESASSVLVPRPIPPVMGAQPITGIALLEWARGVVEAIFDPQG